MKIHPLLLVGLLLLNGGMAVATESMPAMPLHQSTADHSQFDVLDDEFDFAPDVTEACLECHTQAAQQIHKTMHWTWAAKVDDKMVGKGQNGFNNYCVAARGNSSCTQCHTGYGWRNDDFDHEAEENVDCLVCHDTTGTYKKSSAMSGHPYYEDTKVGKEWIKGVDLRHVAQNVGLPQRENCLACHANGGGGNGVKHGDTDMSLVDPVHELDVHMSEKLNFNCQTCHQTGGHQIAGRYYDKPAFTDHESHMGRSDHMAKNVTCESCHSEQPHDERQLDQHTAKVACASCHIPEMARGPYATKLSWDWSSAGKLKDGKPYVVNDIVDGVEVHTYMSKKGDFTWGRNVEPSYRWYKGELQQMTLLDEIDPNSAPIEINPPTGDYLDPLAKIWPFKIHKGKQPFDTVHKRMLPIYLVGKKGSGALWSDFDWKAALAQGAKNNEVPFSGEFDFIESNGYWPIKHMVAPQEQALSCESCHSRQSRLAGLNDFYLLGRDRNIWVEAFGLIAIIGGLAGVTGHSLFRYFSAIRRKKAASQQSENHHE